MFNKFPTYFGNVISVLSVGNLKFLILIPLSFKLNA